ncbi:MAG: SDR family oxidoreductase [Rhodospirillaceae bacterium]|nr:SDR family oxidoreductase [Rhodospirillaceae bacterium]
MGKFDGRIALVTNTGGTTGQAICSQLEKDGATVVSADFDVTSVEGWGSGLAVIGDKHGRLDILVTVSEAKYDSPKPIAETTLEEFRRVNRDNIEAAFLGNRYGVVKMREFGKGGSIINVAPATATVGVAGQAAFCASANGIRMMTRGAALSCCEAKDRIRVNCVQAGRIDGTPDGDVMADAHIPLGRAGTVDDIAEAVAFLASDEAYYITGYVLPVDGGLLAA